MTSRRAFIQSAATSAAAISLSLGGCVKQQADRTKKALFHLGLASYTFREFDLDDTLAMTQRLGLTRIVFKDFHLPLDSSPDSIREACEKVKAAGLDLYGAGVIYMRTEEEVRHAFEYARLASIRMIIGVPNHELLDLTEEMVRQFDIRVAIHNHGPGDKLYPGPGDAYERIKGRDPRMGLCLDIGHTMRYGVDPSEAALRYSDRLIDVHIKDVSSADAQGGTVEIGRGVIDIPKFLITLIRIGYRDAVSFEFEKDGADPLPGLAESVGYVRGVLAAI